MGHQHTTAPALASRRPEHRRRARPVASSRRTSTFRFAGESPAAYDAVPLTLDGTDPSAGVGTAAGVRGAAGAGGVVGAGGSDGARGPNAPRLHGADEPNGADRPDAPGDVGTVQGAVPVALQRTLDSTVAALKQVDTDDYTDGALHDLMRLLQGTLDATKALRVKVAGELEHRAIVAAGPGREQRAVGPVRNKLREDNQLTPGEAKELGEMGRRLKQAPATDASMAEGKLRPEHAKVITDTIRNLVGEVRDRLEAELVEAAERLAPDALGRLARRLLAEADIDVAMRDEAARHRRRSGKLTQVADGMTHLHTSHSGLDGETVHSAVHAFRRPDAPGEHRTPEQATADAIVAICEAALRSREAPTVQGERPHVLITIDQQALRDGLGCGEGMFTGPIPAPEVARLARDAKLTHVVIDPVGVPLAISEARNVTGTALWRALLVRDRGCRWPGCDAPPSWCDVAHAEIPDRNGGPRVLANVALLCRRHHRKVDLDGWTMRIRGPAVHFDPPDHSRQGPLVSPGPNRS